MNLPEKVTLVEVGPRDGLQNEPEVLTSDAKVASYRDTGDPVAMCGRPVHLSARS